MRVKRQSGGSQLERRIVHVNSPVHVNAPSPTMHVNKPVRVNTPTRGNIPV